MLRREGRVGYLPIEDHGVIGNLYTAALVGTDGTIDWLCLPAFDSPDISRCDLWSTPTATNSTCPIPTCS
jgi:GH15 family glucan-1,4-alpha-glucosidase